MFLSKDPNGRWYVYFVGEDGKTKRNSTRCKLKSDALEYLQSFKISEYKKRIESKTILLQKFITDFILFADGNFSKSTVSVYERSLNNFLSIVGNIPLSSITPQHFDTYKTERLKTVLSYDDKKTISPITVNIELRTLRASFNTALRWELIKNNPFSRQKLCCIPESSPIFFNKSDFQKLLNTIKEGWLKEMIIFATLTGLRRGEILNLHWSDIDLHRKTITVQSSPTFKTKNGKKRIVPINDTALYVLQSKANKSISDFVFTLNDKPIFGGWLSHKFKWYVYECRLPDERLHFHSLRHTFASWLVQDGVSIYAVKELLGHSDVKTTQVYSHLQPEQLHSTVNKIQISIN